MRVKIKTWEAMEKEFGLDGSGSIYNLHTAFNPSMESLLPEDRIIDRQNFDGWHISDYMIECEIGETIDDAQELAHKDEGFDGLKNKIKDLTDERGKNYGHPADHFGCTRGMYDEWTERYEDNPIEAELGQCLKHIVYMICDKLARAANNPMHMDNFEDIQGYAFLWEKCVDRRDEI